MSAESAPERRRGERRRDEAQRFWRALKVERRHAERRRSATSASPDASSERASRIAAGKASRSVRAPASPEAEPPVVSPPPTRRVPGEDAEAARRATLRQLLAAAEARQQRATLSRRPVLARGVRVKALRGEFAGRRGVVTDADYIHGRALVAFADVASPQWVGFSRLTTDDDAPPASEANPADVP